MNVRIALLVALLVAANIFLGFTLARESQNALATQVQSRMTDLACTAAALLNGDELATLKAEDINTPAYQKALATLDAFDDNVDRLFWANKPTKDAYERGVADIVPLVDSIIDALKKASIVFTSFNFYLHTGKYIYALGLLSDIIANVEQYQRDNDTLLLSNTGDILKAVITGTGDAISSSTSFRTPRACNGTICARS